MARAGLTVLKMDCVMDDGLDRFGINGLIAFWSRAFAGILAVAVDVGGRIGEEKRRVAVLGEARVGFETFVFHWTGAGARTRGNLSVCCVDTCAGGSLAFIFVAFPPGWQKRVTFFFRPSFSFSFPVPFCMFPASGASAFSSPDFPFLTALTAALIFAILNGLGLYTTPSSSLQLKSKSLIPFASSDSLNWSRSLPEVLTSVSEVAW
jgi:hypothetical protein